MDESEATELFEWVSEIARRQSAMEILFTRLAREIDALNLGAEERIYAPLSVPPNGDAGIIGNLNALIADIRGE